MSALAQYRDLVSMQLRSMRGDIYFVAIIHIALSAGLVCFQVGGLSPQQVVDRLHARNVIATVTPYSVAYPRLAASLLNNETQVDAVLDAVRAMA